MAVTVIKNNITLHNASDSKLILLNIEIEENCLLS